MKKAPDTISLYYGYNNCNYKISMDFVKIGDYIYDFERRGLGKDPIVCCDIEVIVRSINSYYEKTPEFIHRKSVKIVASNDSRLFSTVPPL